MKGIQNTTTSNFGSLIGNGRRYIVPKFQTLGIVSNGMIYRLILIR